MRLDLNLSIVADKDGIRIYRPSDDNYIPLNPSLCRNTVAMTDEQFTHQLLLTFILEEVQTQINEVDYIVKQKDKNVD